MHWDCIGAALGLYYIGILRRLYCDSIETVLGLYWICIGIVLELHRDCIVLGLGLSCGCIVLGLRWDYIGNVLGID